MEVERNIPAKGSLAWPGDHDLLAKYGVTPSELANKIADIIDKAMAEMKSQIEQSRKDGCTGMNAGCYLENRKYKITADVKFHEESIKKITCAYCKIEFKHDITFTVQNRHNGESFQMANIVRHIVEEHEDFGDPGVYRLDPTRACKTLELGNTELDEDDPLFKIRKLSIFTKDQLAQKEKDDQVLAEKNITSEQIVNRIQQLVSLSNRQDNHLEVTWEGAFGYDYCSLCDPEKQLSLTEGTIKDIKTGKEFPISNLVLHSISEHGYFSKNPKYRIDPLLSIEVLRLEPLKEIDSPISIEDQQLLDKYGVTVKEIEKNIKAIITLAEKMIEIQNNPDWLGDTYKVKKEKLYNKQKVTCIHCDSERKLDALYKIKNIFNREEFTISDYGLHLLTKHGSLGSPLLHCKINRIDTTNVHIDILQTCKTLKIGNAEVITDSDSLQKPVNLEKFTEKQLAQKEIEDETFKKLNVSPKQLKNHFAYLLDVARYKGKEKDKPIVIGNVEIIWKSVKMSKITCNVCVDTNKSFWREGKVQNIKTGKSFLISQLATHGFKNHDFFALDPTCPIDIELAVDVLELAAK